MSEMSVERQIRFAKLTLNRITKDYKNDIESFTKRVQSYGPSEAIRWSGEPLVIIETQMRLVRRIYNGVAKYGFVEALRIVLKDVQRDLMNNYGGGGNLYTIANESAMKEAKARFYDRFSYYLESIDEAIAEEQEKVDLQENVTDTTTYALRAQYCTLLNQMQKLSREQIAAKTQRDRLAFETAGQAVANSISDLSKLAHDLGIELT